MPLFEFECTACGIRFERILKSGPRAPRCPECAGRSRRLPSAPAIQFKGSGWYLTDYARKGKDKGSDAGAGEGSKGGTEKPSAEKPASGKKDAAQPAAPGKSDKSSSRK